METKGYVYMLQINTLLSSSTQKFRCLTTLPFYSLRSLFVVVVDFLNYV
jgi:hypothetical protein